MNYLKSTRLILILVIVLAGLLRLLLLGQFPVGITIDEAGQGYSAYSILKTGKDEWEDFLPLNPRGFGDYKPPLMMYLLVPSVAVFGLSEFAVRFPSAIAGILTVWVMFFLGRDLFKSKKIGILASFLLAISPWHVYYSRLGWESNIGLLFFCLGIWLFLKSLHKGFWLSMSIFSFGLSALSYHSYKVLAPLMIAGLAVIFWRQMGKTGRKSLIFPAIVGLFFVLILGYGFLFSGSGRRAQDQSILKEENLSILRQMQFEDKLPQPLNRILNNKYLFTISKISDNYIGYYSLPFLFGPHRSDGSILNFPSLGLLYIWQLPLLFLGIFHLFKHKSPESAVVFLWLVIAPIPASLTQDYMHAGRAQALFPALTIISSLGLVLIFELIKRNSFKTIGIYGFALIIIASLVIRIDNYLFHTFNRPLGGLKQGYKEIINFTEENKDKYSKVIFTKSESEPQAFLAFYNKIKPQTFQQEAQYWKSFEDRGLRFLDMADYNLGKYEFKNIDLSRDRNERNVLIIGTPEEIPPGIIPKYTIKNQAGDIVFIAVESDEIPK